MQPLNNSETVHVDSEEINSPGRKIDRRDFLKLLGGAGLGLAISSIARKVDAAGALLPGSGFDIQKYSYGEKRVPLEIQSVIDSYVKQFPELQGKTWKDIFQIVCPKGEWITVINFDNAINVDPSTLAEVYASFTALAKQGNRFPYEKNTQMSVSNVFVPADSVIGLIPDSIAKNPTHTLPSQLTGTSNLTYINTVSKDELKGPTDAMFRKSTDKTTTMLVNEIGWYAAAVFPIYQKEASISQDERSKNFWLYGDIFINSQSRAWYCRQIGKTWQQYQDLIGKMFIVDNEKQSHPLLLFDKATYDSLKVVSRPLIY